MKKISLLLLLYISIISCENNSGNQNSIEGKWNITKVIGGFMQPVNYNKGDITWLFDLNQKTITIENKVDVFDNYHLVDFSRNKSGTYTFGTITENNIDYLIVGERKGEIKFTESGLQIDYGIAFDDIAYNFTR